MTHLFSLILEFNKTIQVFDLFGSTILYPLSSILLGINPIIYVSNHNHYDWGVEKPITLLC